MDGGCFGNLSGVTALVPSRRFGSWAQRAGDFFRRGLRVLPNCPSRAFPSPSQCVPGCLFRFFFFCLLACEERAVDSLSGQRLT